jgi:hypothetical protein
MRLAAARLAIGTLAIRRSTCGDFCPRVRVSWFMDRSGGPWRHPLVGGQRLGSPTTLGPFPVQRAPRGVTVVSPDRFPGPPECRLAKPARGRRTLPSRLPGLEAERAGACSPARSPSAAPPQDRLMKRPSSSRYWDYKHRYMALSSGASQDFKLVLARLYHCG